MKKILSTLIFGYCLLSSIFLYAQADGNDYKALRDLYLSTGGDSWFDRTGWPDATTFINNATVPLGTDMSTWYGVVLNGNGRISELDIGENQLIGTIPASIDGLAEINGLYLYDNQLSGSIPSEIGNLSNLIELDFGFNELTGNIPPEIGNLINLESLDLYTNQLTGSIPPEIGGLDNLTRLDLNDNQLSGNIPDEIGNMSNLSQLYLYFNQLTGGIPCVFSDMSSLTELALNDNQLSGFYNFNLQNLCSQLVISANGSISEGNNFEADWEDFCNNQLGVGVLIDLQVYLEGAYDAANNELKTILNTERGLLPGQTPINPLISPTPAGQPYNIAPWNYNGGEGSDWTDVNYSADMVDWILVSFRTNIEKNTTVAQAAGILNKDGSVQFPACTLLSQDFGSLYVVIEHRNHMGIMSPYAVPIVNGVLSYDFRAADSYKDATSFGQKQLTTGDWCMFVGDANQSDFPSYDINGTDKSVWVPENGLFEQYSIADFNLDGDINGADKAFWDANNGVSSRVPK